MDALSLSDDRCCAAHCRRPPVMTYLERRLCQFHWKEHCRLEDDAEAAAAEPAASLNGHPETTDGAKEHDMTNKSNSTKKRTPTKARKAGVAKAAAPKAVKPSAADKPKRLSALDAAAKVLSKTGKPMRCPDMIEAMASQKLWTSPNGKTPDATLAAAIIREIRVKGRESRFKKVDRGQFAFAG